MLRLFHSIRWIITIALLVVAYKHTHWSVFGILFLLSLTLEVYIYIYHSRNKNVDSFILYLRGEYIKERLIKVAEKALKDKDQCT